MVEDMSRNKFFFFCEFRISDILRFILICDLFTDSSSYKGVGYGSTIGHFSPGVNNSLSHCVRGWVVPRAALEKRKTLEVRGK
jgi:hypothetical protein